MEYTSAQKTIGNLEEEELPPPETVLSGLEGEFTKDSGGSPKEPEQAAAAEAKGAGDEEKAGGEQEGGEEKEHGEAEAKEEEPEEEEEEEEKPVIQVRTSAYDARFPSINQVSAALPSLGGQEKWTAGHPRVQVSAALPSLGGQERAPDLHSGVSCCPFRHVGLPSPGAGAARTCRYDGISCRGREAALLLSSQSALRSHVCV